PPVAASTNALRRVLVSRLLRVVRRHAPGRGLLPHRQTHPGPHRLTVDRIARRRGRLRLAGRRPPLTGTRPEPDRGRPTRSAGTVRVDAPITPFSASALVK